MRGGLLFLLCLGVFCSMVLQAAPYVPPELDPWVEWVKEAHPEQDCPRDAASGDVTRCIWISRLELDVGDALTFRMNVRVYAETAVTLPGDTTLRPISVTADGQAIAVTGQEQPRVLLEPGSYSIAGQIRWTHRPASIAVPAQYGLLALTVDGAQVPQPLVRGSAVVLARSTEVAEEQSADTQTVDVYRLVRDDEPLRLITEVHLDVAGRPRLLTLGRALLDGLVLTRFESVLPARINAAGDLEVQATAGQYVVRFETRALRNFDQIGMERRGDIWPEQEIWGFVPDRNLRLVEAGGAPGMDLTQAGWPFSGEEAQGFLVSKDASLQLTQMQRGNPEPPPDTINVAREIWVNFDGEGFIVKDQLNAEIRQAKRLAASYPLGRIELNGEPELVNTVEGSEPGIELEEGTYTIESVSAVARDSGQLANGWQVDAQALSATLHLPPGWRLMWAQGADRAPGSWLDGWSLWNIFVLVFAVVLSFRFLRPAFAVLSLAGLLLLLPQQSAIAVCWLLAIGAVAVLQRFDEGKLARVGRFVTWVWLGITAMATLFIAISSAQQAVYPQLEERNEWDVDDGAVAYAEPASADMPMEEAVLADADQMRSLESAVSAAPAPKIARQVYNNRYREGVQVQTGPGLPQWRWNAQTLEWSGPVAASQTLELMLAPPVLVRLSHALTALVSVLVIALLFLALLNRDRLQGRLPGAITAWLPVLLIAMVILPDRAMAASTPSPEILETLEERLLEKPACFPGCASVESLVINLDADSARLDLTVHAGALVSLPLPASRSWMPASISIDGDPAVLTRDGETLEMALPRGVHRVVISGATGHLERFEVALPWQPGLIDANVSSDWRVSGVIEGRAVGGALGFERQKREVVREEDEPSLQQEVAPPFVEVRRAIRFDLDWQVETEVVRLSPAVGGFTVKVALLPGESILTGGYQAERGVVDVVFGPADGAHNWSSTLKRESPLLLKASESTDQTERWSLNTTNLWHIAHEGLVPVLDESRTGQSFRPRGGESLQVTAVPTEPLPGPTSTVERVKHRIMPGDRLATHQLELLLRASQGGNYLLTLPEGTNSVTSVAIDGSEAPIPLKDNQLALPVLPGETTYAIGWTSEEQVGVRYFANPPKFPTATSNVTTEVEFPQNRWVLFLGGPMMGPAMLFWGVMIVVLILAVGITRIPGIALTRTDAVLLAAGLALCNLGATLLVAVWLLLLAVRPRWLDTMEAAASKNLVQILTGFVTVITVLTLIASVPAALLSTPEMHIQGAGSGSYYYRWFTDHAGEVPPSPWVISLPMWIYRAAMLGWSLWLAFALIRWVRAAWEGFRTPEAWYQPKPEVPASIDQTPSA